MRNRLVVLSVLSIMTALVVIYFVFKKGDHNPQVSPQRVIPIVSQAEVDAIIASQHVETEKQRAYIKKIAEDETFAESELRKIISEYPQAKRAVMLIKAATFPIEFHGKVVDAQHNPLANVKIHYSIGAAFGAGEPVHNKVTTDDNGLYVAKGRGATVALIEFYKEGYRFNTKVAHFYTTTELERPHSWVDYNASNPYISVAEKK